MTDSIIERLKKPLDGKYAHERFLVDLLDEVEGRILMNSHPVVTYLDNKAEMAVRCSDVRSVITSFISEIAELSSGLHDENDDRDQIQNELYDLFASYTPEEVEKMSKRCR